MEETLKYLFLVFPLVGVFLVIGGISYRRNLRSKAAVCERASVGTVISNAAGMAGGFDPTPVYRPMIEYFVGNGRYLIAGNVGHLPRKKEGTKLVVMYNPANPSVAFILEDYYTGANIVFSIGWAFVLLGSLLAYVTLSAQAEFFRPNESGMADKLLQAKPR